MDNRFNSAVTIRLVELLKRDMIPEDAVKIVVEETLESLNSFYNDVQSLNVDTANNVIDILDKNITILKTIDTEETKICYKSLLHIKNILFENILRKEEENVQD